MPILHHYHFRRIQLIPALATLIAVIVLISLGMWQVQRLAWKEALIARFDAAQKAEPLTSLPPKEEFPALEFRHVRLHGHYLYEHTLLKVGAYPNARTGFYLLTPFQTGGQTIIVERGFVPGDKSAVEQVEAASPKGEVEVEGILRAGRVGGIFMPANQPEKNIWFSENIDQMAALTGLKLAPIMVEAEKKDLNPFPLPNTGGVTIRNDHLGYAITWFLLAFICVAMFGIYQLERKKP